MIDVRTFAHPALPGFEGHDLGAFTIFATEAGAAALVARYSAKFPDAETFGEARVLPRADGKFLVALVDAADATFFYMTNGAA